MTRLDFGFQLFQYSLVLFATGIIAGMFLHWSEDGWPAAKTRWAYPLLIGAFACMVLIAIVEFVVFVRAFK